MSIGDAYATLCGFRGGNLVGDCLLPETYPIVAKTDGGDRLDLEDSFDFYIPSDWRSGTVTFRAAVWILGVGADTGEVTLTFREADPLNFVLIPMHLHENYDRSDPTDIY